MTVFIGIDLEQFVVDPHATGIQRVLHALARLWPDELQAAFVVPDDDGIALIEPTSAAELLAMAFAERTEHDDLAVRVREALPSFEVERIHREVTDVFSHWLLPEVSYLPSVTARARHMLKAQRSLTMIGYDALPMTEPWNYRFVPGNAARINEYFRLLSQAPRVVAISDYSRESIGAALHRRLPTSVAHPGGDHVEITPPAPSSNRLRLLRVGTMEARKQPVQITQAFCAASDAGLEADLVFIGRPSASDESINTVIREAIAAGYPITWLPGVPDERVYSEMRQATHFLSFGVEGYGIPVLESIRLGTPVLYAGVQPAAEIMSGKGARRIPAGTEAEITQAFLGLTPETDNTLDPMAVPTWQAFVDGVTGAIVH